MREQLVPKAYGEIVVDSCEDGDEVRFESFDGYFSNVAAMAVGLNA